MYPKINHRIFFLYFIFCFTSLQTVNSQWVPNFSLPENPDIFRYDDIYFTSATHGTVGDPKGIFHTTFDGGETWIQSDQKNVYIRSVEYISPSVGFAGSLENKFFQTLDGGISWNDISNRLPGENKSICGLAHIGDSIVFGVGVFYSPARFFKSTDAGLTWTMTEIDNLLNGAVDVHFLDEMHGFIAGTGPQNLALNEEGIILYTSDGGDTWSKIAGTGRATSYVWKLEFTSALVAYASVQNFTGEIPSYMKSIDGGMTWTYYEFEKTFPDFFDAQGIGFQDENIGWLAGYGTGIFETRNGGEDWVQLFETQNINRFFKRPDGKMFAAGYKVYSRDTLNTAVNETEFTARESLIPHSIKITSSNPVMDQVSIECNLDARTMALLDIYSTTGTHVSRLSHQILPEGTHSFSYLTGHLPPGKYFVSLRTFERHLFTSFIILGH
ncbi:MAG: hypothetical protein IPI60_09565 [Saprospiraceae bacterium]|nr:hypothetical protein [Saprospiraceae bacterium]